MPDHNRPGQPILKMQIKFEPDVVTARQKTRRLAAVLGFETQDQVRLATAVSELARNAFQYAGGGFVEFFFDDKEPQTLFTRVSDSGPGIPHLRQILDGQYISKTGMGVGLAGSKKLMDRFEIETADTGTRVLIGKSLAPHAPRILKEWLPEIANQVSGKFSENPFEEIQNQNRELLNALQEIRASREEMAELNRELDEKAVSLQRANEAAQSANVAKTRFLSNMSHEIRTPLGIIQGFADLALNPANTDAERAEYLATIKRNAINLTKLLGEILDLAKIEAGRIEIESERFALPPLLEDLTEAMSIGARDGAVAINLSFVGLFPEFVLSDSVRVRQVVTNLLSNAVKFTERGHVEVVASSLSRNSESDPLTISIEIRDTGIGLSKAQCERLFEAFIQADSSTTRRFGGTGLGLNLSKKLALALGGDLTLLSSTPGEGSRFLFTFTAGVLPDAELTRRTRVAAEPSAPPSFERFQGDLCGFRVLLVEDSKDNQSLFTHYLRNAGAEVDIASDGLEAIAILIDHTYDAILMDIQMPNLDGYDTTRELRRSGLQTPIIALTAHAMQAERDRALAKGFTDYLTKPLNQRLLIETLSQFKTSRSEAPRGMPNN